MIELLSEVPYLTWPLELGECPVQQVREGDYCTMAPLQLLPSIIVPPRTCGSLVPANVRLVAWNTPTNAWQVLLAIMNMLGLEVSRGQLLMVVAWHPSHCTCVFATDKQSVGICFVENRQRRHVKLWRKIIVRFLCNFVS